MVSEIYLPRFEARIVGTIDATQLVPIDPQGNGRAAAAAADAAMAELLDTTELDLYLSNVRNRQANSARWTGIPFGFTGVSLPAMPTATQSQVSVWIEDDPDRARVSIEQEQLSTPTPLSSVVPAIMFRHLFGEEARTFELGPELGRITFTPTHIEVGWRPGSTSGAGSPWWRFDYNDPGVGNYLQVSQQFWVGERVWLWRTDPATGQAAQESWHKVSLVVPTADGGPDERIDDPLEPPPYLPPLLV